MARAADTAEIAALEARVEEAPGLTAELLTRYRTARPVRGVMVTDLLDPRPAYWRSVRPIPPTPEEAARLRDGQEWHERLGRALAPAHAREVRVRRNGIVGRIDVVDGRPIELKSSATPPRADDDLRASRPSYLEQLAMYAALSGQHEGRLIVVGAGHSKPPVVAVWDVRVGRPAAVEEEMVLRATALRSARERSDPTALPRCAWYDRSCAFRAAGLCDCSGAEPPMSGSILDELGDPTSNPTEARRIVAWLAETPPTPGSFARFRELAYPRRAFYDTFGEMDPAPESPGTPGEADETWSALQAVLEGGPPGEYELRHAESGEPAEAIACFRSEPCLVKSTRTARPVPADRLSQDRPHYLLELALRCAALGTPAGYVFTGLERVPSEGPWIHAQRVSFAAPSAARSLLERRASGLTEARTVRDPSGLPACPLWMAERCPHRAVCGCASVVVTPGS
jgi:hypothetical protein